MVEVSKGEEFEPRFGLRFGTMDKFVGSSELAAEMIRDLIDHHGRVADGVVPEFSANLLFGDKVSGHGDDCPPCSFGETVG